MASDRPQPAPQAEPPGQSRPAAPAQATPPNGPAWPGAPGAQGAASTPANTPKTEPASAPPQPSGKPASKPAPAAAEAGKAAESAKPQAASPAAKPAPVSPAAAPQAAQPAVQPAGGTAAASAPPKAAAQPAPAATQPKPAAPEPTPGRLIPADAATAAAAARAAAARPAPAPAQAPATAAQPASVPAAPRPVAPPPAPRPASPPPPAVPPQAAVFPPVAEPAPVARPKRRHWVLLFSLFLLVILPTALWGAYLWTRATDQFSSTVGFSVRREEGTPSIDMFGGIFGGSSSGTASDTDILYEFIRSPDLVQRTDETLDIRAMFSRNWPQDFVFAFNPEGTIEDLTNYWRRQVSIYYDDSSGIITVKVSAFTPEDAKAIADTVFAESERVVNSLSEHARRDATTQAEAELEKSRAVLTEARQAMTAFRVRTRIVDPTIDLGAQMTVMTTLQGQLAEAQVALDQLRQNARAGDQRIVQAELRVASLENQIEQERDKFGGDTPDGENYAEMMADYERLKVDLEFAEGMHQSSRIAYESALAAAQRQTRYLAAHITPTLAQRSLEPARPWLLALGAGMAFLLWSIMILVYYSVRDRR
ncbi:capsule biosynthesis protein [Paracoccus sp. MC1854]|uniref:capsule biosynthesis protein n=1 Tax=Paracoccus sp. MC1854 TaxID=2760306 RepID=UPI0016027DC1|nr:capsule biosynthesis protein [Paracoccus sp. MC1854]MBB1490522.1 capsule biosynthesis protein [Paracoccus sp. MC1854]